MLAALDVEKGERYWFAVAGETFTATFIKLKSDGELAFKREDAPGRCNFARSDFMTLRGKGDAVRVREGQAQPRLPSIEPDAFQPIAEGDSKNVIARKKKYLKAVTQQYYVTCIDEFGIPHSIKKIQKFLDSHLEEHKKLGLSKMPGASTLLALCRECGQPGFRPIQLFLNGAGGDQKSTKWDQFILNSKALMIEMFYTFSKPLMSEAYALGWFLKEIAAEQERREAVNGPSLKVPAKSTVMRWLVIGGTEENKQKRLGRTVTNRQMGGIVPHLSASRPLELVVMDHTQIDLHVVVLDEYGEVRDQTSRPWLMLVVDVYTRMILAANLTWENPSLYTLMEGLKQAVRPKAFLAKLATSPSLAYACDGFGKFDRMLVDNDLANVGQSMRMTAFSVGLNVALAAVKNPETKSIGERTFETLNLELWHQAFGGVRERPGVLKDDDPSGEARFTLDEAQDLLWWWIVNVYHVKVHDGISMAPARLWKESYQFWRRPMIDDMRLIDEVFAKTEERKLTRGGIRYENEIYHDPEMTSGLIRDLYRFNEKNLTGAKKNQSVSISVRVAPLPDGDVSAIRLYNYARRDYVLLPNLDPEKRGTFAKEEVKRIENNRANEAFFPSRQVDVNRGKHLAKIAPHEHAKSATLPETSSPHGLPIHEAEQPMINRKSVQRGAAARKANAAKKKEKEAQRIKRQMALPESQDAASMYDHADAAANVSAIERPKEFSADEKAAMQAAMRLKLGLRPSVDTDRTLS